MRTRIIIGMSAVMLIMLTGCGTHVPNPAPTTQNPIVTIHEGDPVPTLAPPVQLNVLMKATGDPEERCNNMGGHFVPHLDSGVCEDVDY